MTDWMVGQRCASLGELSLGLGIIKKVGLRDLLVIFPASETERTYARDKVPLKRVIFGPGEYVRDNHGNRFMVKDVKEQNGLLFYLGETELLPETELDHTIVYNKPHEKLLAGFINKPKAFSLRAMAWDLRHRTLSSECRGLLGARIELIPHQLYIARMVTSRRHPRVLLSDEVGLGKTIEAALIFHRLFIAGEVSRVLCLVPGTLVTQWLTEFYRKFNVLFSIMSPQHAEQLQKTHPEMNPYMAHQCVLQDIDALVKEEELAEQIVDADWDLVIVDEAHHLYWSKEGCAPQYNLVEALSHVCGGLLLLTATPRQLGMESHFGRLKLLDPERFDSFEKFMAESDRYTRLADITDRVLAGKGTGIDQEIAELFPGDRDLLELAPKDENYTLQCGQTFIRALIDRHGTGRMVYRNHRKVLSGFPKRIISPIELVSNDAYSEFVRFGLENMRDDEDGQRLLAGAPSFPVKADESSAKDIKKMLQRAWREDPRLQWLVPFIRQNPEDKFLLICSRKSVVLALQEWFGLTKDLEVAVFHEELNLIERDRQAAYFSKAGGAQILLCSEIGSEGRNFQFAHKLILFDLPLNPALLEQRIGRLDRIGQHSDIEIYIPYPENSPMECLYNWYQKGLDAFENHLLEGEFIYEHLKERIFTVFDAVDDPTLLGPFIEESKKFTADLRAKVEQGRDRLLELHSFNKEEAGDLVEMIEEMDDDLELKHFMDEVFEVFGIAVEEQNELETQIVIPTAQMPVESFPALPEEGLEVTYNREVAVNREELAFLSYDHPMVSGAIDLLLSLDRGVTSFALWKGAPEAGMLLECNFILECQGGEEARLSRFLPPTPIRIGIDNNRKPRPDLIEALALVELEKGPKSKLHKMRDALTQIVESLLGVAEAQAEKTADEIVGEAEQEAMYALKEEYDRLKALRAINPSIREDELDYIEETLNIILDYLGASQVRLDAVRLILMVP
ncbi:MAG: RNA polymerase-associated protein RapA [Acidobacteriota bacterium]|nr:RNA polymerase-associated protein RapA [Acidobacteriota bacterium]